MFEAMCNYLPKCRPVQDSIVPNCCRMLSRLSGKGKKLPKQLRQSTRHTERKARQQRLSLRELDSFAPRSTTLAQVAGKNSISQQSNVCQHTTSTSATSLVAFLPRIRGAFVVPPGRKIRCGCPTGWVTPSYAISDGKIYENPFSLLRSPPPPALQST